MANALRTASLCFARAWRNRALLFFAIAACGLFATACEQKLPSGREGPTACCGGRGLCLPTSFVEDRYLELLDRSECMTEERACVPDELRTLDVPVGCRVSATNGEGRCLPSCLPSLQGRESMLGQDGCAEFQVCAPCYDPITGESSGACGLGKDKGAVEPPAVFADCCGELGRCVPDKILNEDQKKNVGRDSCAPEGMLCAPEAALKAGDSYAPTGCTASLFGAEGRCLPACLPAIAKQAKRLKQDGCPDLHLCAPCFDPITREDTGSCSIGTDGGPKDKPKVFGTCCEGKARCVAESLVPEAQRDQLAQQDCDVDGELCVPTEQLEDTKFVAPSCTVAVIGAEGRCLSDCLPAVQSRASVLHQDGCTDDHSCVPCFDPLTGESTGACNQPGDSGPKKPAVKLGACCGALGRCTPRDWVPDDDEKNFGPNECKDAKNFVCVAPEQATADAAWTPQHCDEPRVGAEGRCLPRCMPAVSARASQLEQVDCPAEHLCVPCTDPITGQGTGACDARDDHPSRPATVLPYCCGSSRQNASGVCVSESLLPNGAPALPPQSCTGEGVVCAPKTLAIDPEAKFPDCTAWSGEQAVCIQDCFLDVFGQLLASKENCGDGQLCVACGLLGSGIGGCP